MRVGMNGRLVLITMASVVMHGGAFMTPFLVGSAEREPVFVILSEDRLEVTGSAPAQARPAAGARPEPVRAEARGAWDPDGEESIPGRQREADRGDGPSHQVTSESSRSSVLNLQDHTTRRLPATSVPPPAASPTTQAPADTHEPLAAPATTHPSPAATVTTHPPAPLITDPTPPVSEGIAPMTAGQESARPVAPSAASSAPDLSGSADWSAHPAGSAEKESAAEGAVSERPAGASGRGQESAARGHDGGESGRARERAGPTTDGGAMAGDGAVARVAPGAGGGAVAPSAEYDGYLRALRRQIHELLTYPPAARRRGISGTVLVELIVRPTGEIESISLVRSSSNPALDGAALDAVRAVRPRPFPPDVARRSLRVHLPIVFELR